MCLMTTVIADCLSLHVFTDSRENVKNYLFYALFILLIVKQHPFLFTANQIPIFQCLQGSHVVATCLLVIASHAITGCYLHGDAVLWSTLLPSKAQVIDVEKEAYHWILLLHNSTLPDTKKPASTGITHAWQALTKKNQINIFTC